MERVNTKKIAAIIPAANYTGEDAKVAPLMKLGDATVIERATEALILGGIRDIVLVTGSWRNEIMDSYLYVEDVREVYDADYSHGLFQIVRSGVVALPYDIDAFLILPPDCAAVFPATVQEIVKYFYDEVPDAELIRPEYEGRSGFPMLVSAGMVERIKNRTEKGTLTENLEALAKRIRKLKTGDPGVPYDPTREGYYKLREYSRDYDISRKANAEVLLDQSDAPDHIKQHCRFVAEITETICEELRQAGTRVDEDAAVAAAMLHDVRRLDDMHTDAGRLFAWENGMARAGAVIGSHMGQGINEKKLGAKEVMFLADKYAVEDILISLDRRFDRAEYRKRDSGEELQAVKRIRQMAKAIKRNVERTIGRELDPILIRKFREGMG